MYVERLDQFFEVNEVPDTKKVAFLISVIGSDAYKSLRDLCHPELPKNKTFDELCEHLRRQFSPQVSIFRERAIFYQAEQEEWEKVVQWYGRLKKLSVDCKFGEYLESLLRDKFITGLRPGQILDRLCEESETVTLEQALDIAINKECALKVSEYTPEVAICPPCQTEDYVPKLSNCPPMMRPQMAKCAMIQSDPMPAISQCPVEKAPSECSWRSQPKPIEEAAGDVPDSCIAQQPVLMKKKRAYRRQAFKNRQQN